MQFKRVLFLSLLLFAFIPLGSAFAEDSALTVSDEDIVQDENELDFKNGLLDQPSLIKEITFPAAIYDNDLDTSVRSTIYRRTYVEFNRPINIGSLYLKGSSAYSQNQIIIEFSDGTTSGEIDLSIRNEGYFDFDFQDVVKITLYNPDTVSGSMYLHEIDFFENNQPISYDSISNLKSDSTPNSISLSWKNPDSNDFIGVVIKKNGENIADLQRDRSSYVTRDLEPDTEYEFEVFSKYEGGLSEPVKKTVRTEVEPSLGEVKDLKAEAEHDRVDLSWTLPESEGFHHVNIYRDEIKEEPSLIQRLFSGNVAYAAATTPIFETNGTYFNDRTVQPSTRYEYTLTTTDGDIETSGVSIEVQTLAEPPPQMGGIDGSQQENGDYLYTWETPTDGEVKIIVGGREYATVPAADGSFTVPANDMAYTTFGDPDVSLRPVSPSGVEGEDSSLSPSLESPFGVTDLLEAGNGLLWLIGPIILLALSFILVPKLRSLIINGFKVKKSEDGTTEKTTREMRSGRRTG